MTVHRAAEPLIESPAHPAEAQPEAKLITYSPGPYLVDLSMSAEAGEAGEGTRVRLEGHVTDDEMSAEKSGEVVITSVEPGSPYGPYAAAFEKGFTFSVPQGEYDLRIVLTGSDGGSEGVILELPAVAVTPLLLEDWGRRKRNL